MRPATYLMVLGAVLFTLFTLGCGSGASTDDSASYVPPPDDPVDEVKAPFREAVNRIDETGEITAADRELLNGLKNGESFRKRSLVPAFVVPLAERGHMSVEEAEGHLQDMIEKSPPDHEREFYQNTLQALRQRTQQ